MLKTQTPCPDPCRSSLQEPLHAREHLIVRAFPEVLAVGWMDNSSPSLGNMAEKLPNSRIQRALALHAAQIFSAMPDTFNLRLSASETSAGCRCVLTAEGFLARSRRLEQAVEGFAADADLKRCEPPDMLSFARSGCIALCACCQGRCSRKPEVPSQGLSFRKADLVVYLVWLPETPFEGFLFSACACVHRKTQVEFRHTAEHGPGEDV